MFSGRSNRHLCVLQLLSSTQTHWRQTVCTRRKRHFSHSCHNYHNLPTFFSTLLKDMVPLVTIEWYKSMHGAFNSGAASVPFSLTLCFLRHPRCSLFFSLLLLSRVTIIFFFSEKSISQGAADEGPLESRPRRILEWSVQRSMLRHMTKARGAENKTLASVHVSWSNSVDDMVGPAAIITQH